MVHLERGVIPISFPCTGDNDLSCSWRLDQLGYGGKSFHLSSYMRLLQREAFNLSYHHCLPGKVTVTGDYINYRVKKKFFLDNLCSELMIAAAKQKKKKTAYLAFSFIFTQTPSFLWDIILLFCFASILTLSSSPKVSF